MTHFHPGRLGLICAAGLLLAGCCCAPPPPEQPPLFAAEVVQQAGIPAFFPHRDYRLDNGMRVILVRDEKAPVVVSQLWYRVGAADEVPGKSGLAHMLEHMMFQGTARVAPGDYSKIIARNGGEDNAYTSWDFTAYYAKVASDRLDLVLGLEADRMVNLRLSEEEFRQENKVVREERRSRTDGNPNARMLERFRRTAFPHHPYGRPIIGWMEDIEGLTLADLVGWYRRYYAPNNATLVLVGDLDLAEAARLVERHFGPLSPREGVSPAPLSPALPIDTPRRLEVPDPEAKLPLWYAGFQAPTLSDPAPRAQADSYVLDVIDTLLDGTSGRLYHNLVMERKVAVGVGSAYGGVSRNRDLFTLHAVPAEGHDVAEVERAVLAELQRLAREPLPARELEKAKNVIVSNYVYDQDSAYDMAYLIGRLVTSGIDWRIYLDYPRRIRAVTAADVQAVAGRIFDPREMVVGVLLPQSQATAEATP